MLEGGGAICDEPRGASVPDKEPILVRNRPQRPRSTKALCGTEYARNRITHDPLARQRDLAPSFSDRFAGQGIARVRFRRRSSSCRHKRRHINLLVSASVRATRVNFKRGGVRGSAAGGEGATTDTKPDSHRDVGLLV